MLTNGPICNGCGVSEGEKHQGECPNEECPFCGGSVTACGCRYEQLGFLSQDNPAECGFLPRKIYETGLSESQEAQWHAKLEQAGRVPFRRLLPRKAWNGTGLSPAHELCECLATPARRIRLTGFGEFSARFYKGYTGRNPLTGATVEVPSTSLPVYQADPGLLDDLNGPLGAGGGKVAGVPQAPNLTAATASARKELLAGKKRVEVAAVGEIRMVRKRRGLKSVKILVFDFYETFVERLQIRLRTAPPPDESVDE